MTTDTNLNNKPEDFIEIEGIGNSFTDFIPGNKIQCSYKDYPYPEGPIFINEREYPCCPICPKDRDGKFNKGGSKPTFNNGKYPYLVPIIEVGAERDIYVPKRFILRCIHDDCGYMFDVSLGREVETLKLFDSGNGIIIFTSNYYKNDPPNIDCWAD